MKRVYLMAALVGLALACTHVVMDGARVTTFGTAKTEVVLPDGGKVTSEGDGTNVFGIVAKLVDAARRFFGGGDTVIQTQPAPPPSPESPR